MKILKSTSSFLLTFVIQLLLITLAEFLLFLFSPGIKNELLASLNGRPVESSGLGEALLIFKTWFLKILFAGDFGRLVSSGQPINDFIFDCTFITIRLVTGALLISLLLSIFIIYIKQNFSNYRIVDLFIRTLQFVSSIHYIVLGYVAIMVFPAIRYTNSILPYLILGIGNGVLNDFIHLIESESQQILNSPYIIAAKARGGSLIRNAFAPYTIALFRIVNSKFPMLLGGSFIVEYIMNIYGLGMHILRNGIQGMNYNLLLIITIIITFFIVFVNLLTNQIQKKLDPRPVKAA